MKRLAFTVGFGAAGYLLAAPVTYFLVSMFSSNTHDVSVEAAMTAAFVGGPLGGLAGAIAGFVKGRRR